MVKALYENADKWCFVEDEAAPAVAIAGKRSAPMFEVGAQPVPVFDASTV